jgi:endonuclease/exonuclease/phosphatase family metal-dependent hydrolase
VTLAAQAQARRTKTTRLRALTFNIRFDFQNDGANRWANRVDLVVQTIEKSGAHVICLQEDKAHQVDDLKKRLPNYEFVGRGRNATGSGERCSIVFEKKRFRLKDHGDFWLSDTPDVPGSNTWGDKYPRKVTWAFLESRKGKKGFLVLNTHFPEGKRGHLRLKGSELIAQWIRDRAVQKKRGKTRQIPVLMCGDFNEDAGSDPHTALTGTKEGMVLMRDAWEETPPVDRSPGTYNGFKGLQTRQRIDWLLIGGPVRVHLVGKITDDFDGRYPSDHYPVFADLEIH